MRTAIPLTVLAAAIACSLATAPAQAQRARVFVASYGDDANPCTFGSPCKTFQHAHDVAAAGGEVTAIDSAGFGPITITKAITITSPEGVEAGIVPTAGGNAITINAAIGDTIVLRGLTLNGSGVGANGGANGIVFNSGTTLMVTNCFAQNFITTSDQAHGNGILIQPTSSTIKFIITNTTVLNNDVSGILYLPPSGSPIANGVIDHVVATANNIGIRIDTSSATGASPSVVAISNSIANANSGAGFYADNGKVPLTVSIDNVTAVGNGSGISGMEGTNVLLGRSVSVGNGGDGGDVSKSPSFFTYKDNRINQPISLNVLQLQ
jgi:hypothetical protein